MELKFDQLQLPKRQLLLTLSARVSCVRIKLRNTSRAGFSWWEAWAQWRIWDFRKGLAIELQGFKN